MAVKKLLRMGDARLITRSEFVQEFNTPQLQEMIEDLTESMRDFGCDDVLWERWNEGQSYPESLKQKLREHWGL